MAKQGTGTSPVLSEKRPLRRRFVYHKQGIYSRSNSIAE